MWMSSSNSFHRTSVLSLPILKAFRCCWAASFNTGKASKARLQVSPFSVSMNILFPLNHIFLLYPLFFLIAVVFIPPGYDNFFVFVNNFFGKFQIFLLSFVLFQFLYCVTFKQRFHLCNCNFVELNKPFVLYQTLSDKQCVYTLHIT